MEIVPRCDVQTLVPIITRHITPGSTSWSDEWAAYNGLAGLNGYAHSPLSTNIRCKAAVLQTVLDAYMLCLCSKTNDA